MFGLDPFSLALIGGGIGGLLDKKDPLRGAMLGAGAGYFGPGLLGGAPQAAAPVADAAITPVAGAAAPVAAAPASAAPTGLLSQFKPVMDAAGTAAQVAQMTKEPKTQITPSPMITPMSNTSVGQMVAGMQQEQANKMALEKQLRLQRRQMRGM